MNFHYHFIINEHAASGRAKVAAKSVLEDAKKTVTYTTHYSEYPGHVYTLIQELLPQLHAFSPEETEEIFPLLVVIGGDGTLHEVMNALYPDHLDIPVAYIPSGSGNDFSRGIHLDRSPLKAWEQVKKCRQPQDVNLITYEEAISQRHGVLVNNLGVGLDASIVHATNDSASKSALNKYHMGSFAYIFSILKQLFLQKGFPIRVEVNGEILNLNKAFLCTTTNHPYFGGGVNIAPKANAFSGNFDVVMIERFWLIKIFYLIILLVNKKHLENKNVHYYQATKMRLVSTTPQYAQLDGEVWEKQPYDFNFATITGKIWF